MDILGKKGEQASEELQAVLDAVQDLDSHVNALDNAVQSHEDDIKQVKESLKKEQEILSFIEENQESIKSLRKVFRKFASIQSDYIQNVDILDNELKDARQDISRIESKVNRLENSQDALFEEVEELREKIGEMEEEFIVNSNKQEWDIESKLDESRFDEREKKVDRELSKLRTSLNNLADELDEDQIKVE